MKAGGTADRFALRVEKRAGRFILVALSHHSVDF